jgi:hypothetical protein
MQLAGGIFGEFAGGWIPPATAGGKAIDLTSENVAMLRKIRIFALIV